MTTVRIEEENLDVELVEVKIEANIEIDSLDVNIEDKSIGTVIGQDSLTAVIEEVHIESKIVEEALHIELDEVLIIRESVGSGKIKTLFDFSDFSGSDLPIGNVPDEADISHTIIEIDEPFDGDLQLSVGTLTAQAILMRLDENLTDVGGRYVKTNNLEISGTTNFRLFFVETIPSNVGKGRVTIYFH